MIDLDELQREPWKFDFFDVLRAFEREYSAKPRIGDSASRDDDILVLGQEPFVEFPASNISRFERDARGRFRLYARFMGLLGPQGALPLHTTLEALHFAESGDPAFTAFLDIFNNRFQQLFFRAWSDARPVGQHDRPEDDLFADYVGSVIGLGSTPYKHRDSAPDLAKLSVAGLLGPAVKSACRVEGMLQHLFGVKAEVEQMVGSWLKLDAGEQTALGAANAGLGQEAMMGSSVYTVQDKFRIRIEVRSLAQFKDFLPEGRHFDKLVDLIYFYLGDLLEYEVKLLLPVAEAPQAKLASHDGMEGKGGAVQLGWTSWLASSDESPVRTPFLEDCSFHPAERAAEARGRQTKTTIVGETRDGRYQP